VDGVFPSAVAKIFLPHGILQRARRRFIPSKSSAHLALALGCALFQSLRHCFDGQGDRMVSRFAPVASRR
jgi:hypothetical protein